MPVIDSKFWVLSTLLIFLFACQEQKFHLEIPVGFPQPEFPENNVPTLARVALGEKLFFDKNISADSSISCISCHLPEKAFTDGLTISRGIGDRPGQRNSPSILNAAYLGPVNKDGGVKNLDLQALVPIEDENEMGISILELADRLNKDPEYVDLARKAYQQPPNAFVITRALATFVRTLYSGDSDYDRYIQGDSAALNMEAIQGKNLFESERLNCTACHSGFNFTNNKFENNGLYTQYKDSGRAMITLDSTDNGKFRVPSLRNVALTDPYMHDGSVSTLEEVINHYEKAGQYPTILQSEKIKPFELTAAETRTLIAFLESLTGRGFVKSTSTDQR